MGRTAILGLALLLASCGGDGGSAPAPAPPPTPAPAPAPTPTPAPVPAGNLALSSENWTLNPPYVPVDGGAVSDTISVSVDGRTVRLFRIDLPHAGSALAFTGGHFPTGATLVVSFYVQGPAEGFFWPRPVTGAAHEPKLYDVAPRRVWWVARATSPDTLAVITDPKVPLASTPGGVPYLLYNALPQSITVYAGGLQIEATTAGPQGIALIGDSTQIDDSARADLPETSEPSKWLAGLLNVAVFNRAASGQSTDQMLARWDTDIAPLAANSRYAVIQGGINDTKLGRPLSAIEADISAMADRATAEGMVPVLVTATPNLLSVSDQERVALNDWIRATFSRVIDLDAALRDPNNPSRLRPDLTYDGTHYTFAGRKLAGQVMAQQAFWAFAAPGPYVPN